MFVAANCDNAKNKKPVVIIETSEGIIEVELFPDVAPNHVANFLELAGKGFYNGVIFHRVMDGFMIQGGDPTGTGMGDSGKRINAEFNDSLHHAGTLAMARSPQGPNTASCQFYICLAPQPRLDHNYTVFGRTIKGFDVVQKIGKTQTSGSYQRITTDAAWKAELLKLKDQGSDVALMSEGMPAPDRPLKTVKIIKAYEKK
jgi:cyclophilin family peptidyl-prolyl cis-trans isomerase